MKHSMIGCLAVLALAACGADAPQMPEGEVTELTIVDEQVGNGATAVPGSVARALHSGLEMLSESLPEGPILDVGCGAGRSAAELAAATGASRSSRRD